MILEEVAGEVLPSHPHPDANTWNGREVSQDGEIMGQTGNALFLLDTPEPLDLRHL